MSICVSPVGEKISQGVFVLAEFGPRSLALMERSCHVAILMSTGILPIGKRKDEQYKPLMLKRNDNGEAAQEFYEKRTRWAEYVVAHAGVSDRAFRLGYWLSRRMNGDDQCCWYSVPRIAKELGRSPRWVNRSLAELRAANVVLVIEEKGKANTYFLHAPFFDP